jgi:hypothetical protein
MDEGLMPTYPLAPDLGAKAPSRVSGVPLLPARTPVARRSDTRVEAHEPARTGTRNCRSRPVAASYGRPLPGIMACETLRCAPRLGMLAV